MSLPILWLDSESTGVDCKRNAIIQIAAIDPEGNTFCRNLRPHKGAIISPEALRVNGKTVEEISKYDEPGDVIREFVRWLGGKKYVLAGYNVGFDKDFLFELFKMNGLFFGNYFSYYVIDAYYFAQAAHGLGKLKTTTGKLKLLDVYEAIFCTQFKAHDALDDIRATMKIFPELISMLSHKCLCDVKKQEDGIYILDPDMDCPMHTNLTH
jgi:DNA polymerase III epsilon subunit-like protein